MQQPGNFQGFPNAAGAQYTAVPPRPLHPLHHQAYSAPPSHPGHPSGSLPGFPLVAPSLPVGPTLPTFSGPSGLQRPVFPPCPFFAPGSPVTSPLSNSQRPSRIPGPPEQPAFTALAQRRLLRQQRTAYTLEQKCQLEDLFAKTKYPTLDQVAELEKKLKVSGEKIKVWFKNRRAKSRREQLGAQQQPRAQGPQELRVPVQALASGPGSGAGQGPALVQAPADTAPVPPVSAALQVPEAGQQGSQGTEATATATAEPQHPDEPQDLSFSELLSKPLLSPDSLRFLQNSDSFQGLKGIVQGLGSKEVDASESVEPRALLSLQRDG